MTKCPNCDAEFGVQDEELCEKGTKCKACGKEYQLVLLSFKKHKVEERQKEKYPVIVVDYYPSKASDVNPLEKFPFIPVMWEK